MDYRLKLNCLDCGYHFDFSNHISACPHCQGMWLEATYDYAQIGQLWQNALPSRNFDLWRYQEALPIQEFNPLFSIGEGGTPLIRANNLGLMLGCTRLYIKDERQGPTNSFKDRQAAVSVAAMKEAGITEAVLASTGNVALAYSAYAARAGIRLWAFLTSLVPGEKMREVALYGTQVIKVTGTYDQAKKLAAEFATQRGIYLERGPRSIPSVESMKTIAFEISEGLHLVEHQQPKWAIPDWYIQAVSGGIGPLGVQKGFRELVLMGLIPEQPAMACIQTEGCAPMVEAWKNDREEAEPIISPRTHIATLSTGDPGRAYTLIRRRMLDQSGGFFESVSDEESFHAMHVLAKLEGLSVEPAAAVGFAGLIKLVCNGVIKPTDLVVVNCTGHTMPVENTILGDGWTRDVDVATQTGLETPQEGLFAAISHLAPEKFPCILIVDDTTDARRLIRRMLQSQGNYTILEASSGAEAIEMVNKEPPDLIILDLMMPEIDGFTVLDKLSSEARTASIPVVVITAKELSPDEKIRLKGRINSLMQKGEFMSDDLLDEVRLLIE